VPNKDQGKALMMHSHEHSQWRISPIVMLPKTGATARHTCEEVDSQKAKEALLQIAAEFELLAESAQERPKPKRPAG